jgi:hypothetical protein
MRVTFVPRYLDMKYYSENNWIAVTNTTMTSFKSGELQRAAMALGAGASDFAYGNPQKLFWAFLLLTPRISAINSA